MLINLQASDLHASVVILGGVVGAGDQGALPAKALSYMIQDKGAASKRGCQQERSRGEANRG